MAVPTMAVLTMAVLTMVSCRSKKTTTQPEARLLTEPGCAATLSPPSVSPLPKRRRHATLGWSPATSTARHTSCR